MIKRVAPLRKSPPNRLLAHTPTELPLNLGFHVAAAISITRKAACREPEPTAYGV
jgi:hypothetical protein